MTTTATPRTKQQWRAQLLAARRALPAGVRAVEAVALAAHVRGLLGPGEVVCAHVPVGSEPGSTELLEVLRRGGARVLLPVTRPGEALAWAEFRGVADLVPAALGLREPGGDVLGPDALGTARVVLVPALAVDRSGVRLGKGQGHYDRSLPLAAPGAALVAVVRDEEVVDALPAEPHDVALGWTLTPVGGLRPL